MATRKVKASAPDGTEFPNRIMYREIVPAEWLAHRHGADDGMQSVEKLATSVEGAG